MALTEQPFPVYWTLIQDPLRLLFYYRGDDSDPVPRLRHRPLLHRSRGGRGLSSKLRIPHWLLALLLLSGSVQAQEETMNFRFRTSPWVPPTHLHCPELQVANQETGEFQIQWSPDESSRHVTLEAEGYVPVPLDITPQDLQAVDKMYPPPAMAKYVKLTPLQWWVPWLDDFWRNPYPYLGGVLALVAASLPLTGWWLDARRRRKVLEKFEARRNLSDSMLMQSVGGYLLVEALGSGGMATVYRGLPEKTLLDEEAVAVKLLSREIFQDADSQGRFRREVKAYLRLSHPNIVKVYDFREPDAQSPQDLPYIMLELVRGDTLRSRLQKAGLSWMQARLLLEPLFEAVAYAHGQGVVHRDLKPENIMINSAGQLKVMDFGLSRPMDASQLTRTGTIMGTPSYMAPEQLSGSSAEPTMDQYSLGVVAYEVLTGRLPHEADDMMQLFNRILTANPTPPQEYRPDLPPQAQAALLKMLAREPQERFATVAMAWEGLSGSF